MRLEEIYYICNRWQNILSDINKDLNSVLRDEKVDLRSIFQEIGPKFKIILTEIGRIDILKPQVAELIHYIEYGKSLNKPADVFYSQEAEFKRFNTKLQRLLYDIMLISSLCKSLGYKAYKEGEVRFCVKVPQNSELLDFSKNISEFNVILNQCPILQSNDSQIKLKKVDIGSVWMDFVIVGTGAVMLLNKLAAFVDHAIAIWSHKKTLDQQIQQFKKMQLDNCLIENMINTHDEITKTIVKKVSSELISDNMTSEDAARMDMCFEKMMNLFDKGLEIHEAIEQRSVKPLFPVAEQWKQLQSKDIELLENRNDDN